jgi:hypothetical protein
MDALGVPLKARQYRLGHSRAGDITTDAYTHFQIGRDNEVANRLGSVLSKEAAEFFALNLPKTKRASGGVPKALENKQQIGCGGQI